MPDALELRVVRDSMSTRESNSGSAHIEWRYPELVEQSTAYSHNGGFSGSLPLPFLNPNSHRPNT